MTQADEGISGRRATKRPAFQRMIAEAKSKKRPFDTILVWKFSRFARNQEESIVYKSMLARDGVNVISITEPTIDGPFGSLIERIIEWMDEYYSIRLAEEVKKGMTEKAIRGGLQSTPSFGYAVDKNILVPVPKEADLVREIFNRFIAGEGYTTIARWINAMGVTTHRGNNFENRTVEYIIRNPVYIGKLRWNPAGRSRRDFDNEHIIVADAAHEPIIDMDTWEAAQARVRLVKAQWRRKARPTWELKDWPSGLVRCSECSGTLVFNKPHFYRCNNWAKGRCGSSQHVRADLLKEAIIDRLTQDSGSPVALDTLTVHKRDQADDERGRMIAYAESLEKKKTRLREAYLNGIDTVEEYRVGKQAVDDELEEVRDRISKIEGATVDVAAVKAAISAALETLTSPTASIEEKHNAAVGVVASCVWDKSLNLLTLQYRAIF